MAARGRGRFHITAQVLLPRAAAAACRPGVCSLLNTANHGARFTAAEGATVAPRSALIVVAHRSAPSTAAGAMTRYPATAVLATNLFIFSLKIITNHE